MNSAKKIVGIDVGKEKLDANNPLLRKIMKLYDQEIEKYNALQ